MPSILITHTHMSQDPAVIRKYDKDDCSDNVVWPRVVIPLLTLSMAIIFTGTWHQYLLPAEKLTIFWCYTALVAYTFLTTCRPHRVSKPSHPHTTYSSSTLSIPSKLHLDTRPESPQMVLDIRPEPPRSPSPAALPTVDRYSTKSQRTLPSYYSRISAPHGDEKPETTALPQRQSM